MVIYIHFGIYSLKSPADQSLKCPSLVLNIKSFVFVACSRDTWYHVITRVFPSIQKTFSRATSICANRALFIPEIEILCVQGSQSRKMTHFFGVRYCWLANYRVFKPQAAVWLISHSFIRSLKVKMCDTVGFEQLFEKYHSKPFG